MCSLTSRHMKRCVAIPHRQAASPSVGVRLQILRGTALSEHRFIIDHVSRCHACPLVLAACMFCGGANGSACLSNFIDIALPQRQQQHIVAETGR